MFWGRHPSLGLYKTHSTEGSFLFRPIVYLIYSTFSFLLVHVCLVSFYLLIEEEVLNAVGTDVIGVQQTIEFEAESELADRVWVFSWQTGRQKDKDLLMEHAYGSDIHVKH